MSTGQVAAVVMMTLAQVWWLPLLKKRIDCQSSDQREWNSQWRLANYPKLKLIRSRHRLFLSIRTTAILCHWVVTSESHLIRIDSLWGYSSLHQLTEKTKLILIIPKKTRFLTVKRLLSLPLLNTWWMGREYVWFRTSLVIWLVQNRIIN
jgi:hypothetical protein